jgi:hypothetical protein
MFLIYKASAHIKKFCAELSTYESKIWLSIEYEKGMFYYILKNN